MEFNKGAKGLDGNKSALCLKVRPLLRQINGKIISHVGANDLKLWHSQLEVLEFRIRRMESLEEKHQMKNEKKTFHFSFVA